MHAIFSFLLIVLLKYLKLLELVESINLKRSCSKKYNWYRLPTTGPNILPLFVLMVFITNWNRLEIDKVRFCLNKIALIFCEIRHRLCPTGTQRKSQSEVSAYFDLWRPDQILLLNDVVTVGSYSSLVKSLCDLPNLRSQHPFRTHVKW